MLLISVIHPQILVAAEKFLTLPFKDARIFIQQGWVYSTPLNGSFVHNGIDYVNGIPGSDPSTWESFDVVASADGLAMQSSGGGYGNFVIVRHNETNDEGKNIFTLYAHLQTVSSKIIFKENRNDTNYLTWTPIERGQKLGEAGDTGSPGVVHLHFEVNIGGYAQDKTDPYDIMQAREFYPGNSLFSGCGLNFLWTECPPLTESQPTIPPIIQEFNFALDTFAVDGNILGSGNADGFFDFFDDFNDGSLTTPPTSLFSFPQGVEATNESVGFLNFTSSDGAFVDDNGDIFDHAELSHFLTNGGGDSVIAATFRADTPGEGLFYSLGISDVFNTKPNLAFVFVRSFPDESNAFVVAQQVTGEGTETLAISEIDLTLVDRIILLFVLFDDTNELIPLYSIDEGMTFIEFSSQPLRVFTTGNNAAVFAQGGVLADFRCGDGIDNDGDGLIDLDDPDCDS